MPDTPTPVSSRATVADPTHINAVLTDRFEKFYGERKEVRVHPAAFAFEPQGSRLTVVCYPNPEHYGGLSLPASAGEQAGLGVVLAVGRDAFNTDAPHPGAGLFPGPKGAADMLCRTVAFGKYAGKPLVLNYTRDGNFNAEILVLCDRDIWCVMYPEQYGDYSVPNDYLAPHNQT